MANCPMVLDRLSLFSIVSLMTVPKIARCSLAPAYLHIYNVWQEFQLKHYCAVAGRHCTQSVNIYNH